MDDSSAGSNGTLERSYPPHTASTDEWHDWCRERLIAYSKEINTNPMTNSVQRLGHDLTMALEQGSVTLSQLKEVMDLIGNEALLRRADNFRDAHEPQKGAGSKSLQEECDEFVMRIKAQNKDFKTARNELERTRAGIVFTGHPTFAIAEKLRDDFVTYVESEDPKQRETSAKALTANPHRPDEPITIESEHDAVLRAIANASDGLDQINGALIDAAQKHFPDEWEDFCPTPVSVATWVGYDLDGRTDIHWGQTLTIRLKEKAAQLNKYSNSLSTIAKDVPQAQELADQLARATDLTQKQAGLFSGDLNDSSVVVEAANMLTKDQADRLTKLDPIINKISTLIKQTDSEKSKRALCLLRAQMKACGLGVSRIHLRVNATQVRSALRHDLGVNTDADFMGRGTMEVAAKQASITAHNEVNFASVFLEKMTARRQFMLCAQILKHVDEETPIRFLIAECEAPATVMGAVYLARAYGVAEHLDISPLFETPSALERGGRFMERLIQEDEYVAYAKERGRISIQLGFSDSGRFMGQLAADLAIERLHILLARVMNENGLNDVEALVFNTNGESMGRGGFPGTIEDRLHHLITPWTRGIFAKNNIAVNVESAFQGGEGFLHFQTPSIAGKTMNEIFRVSFADWQCDEEDMFYKDINFSWDYYRGVKAWQEDLFENPDYTRAIASFGQKLLFTTGSRKVRRSSKGVADMSPRALRAIPHNAILQQMAIPVNVACGTGATIHQEADRFVSFVQNSDRMRRLLEMAENARNLTSLPAFLGYANIYNASYWTRRATSSPDPTCASCYLVIAKQLQDQEVYTALGRLANLLGVDLSHFDGLLSDIHDDEHATSRRENRLGLHILHSIRQSAIMYALILISQLPGFSGRHEVTHEDLFDDGLHLRFDELTERLSMIFPAEMPEAEAMTGIEEHTNLDLSAHLGYPQIESEVIEPLRTIETLIQETGVAISHFYGAYG